MINQDDSQIAKRKRNPLGKSLSDIFSHTSPKTAFRLLEKSNADLTISSKAKEIGMVNQDYIDSIYLLNLNKIGEILKAKREDKNLTVQYISDYLCITKSIINSIELGNWVNLPHKVYVQGYIKKYALLLEVYDEIRPYLLDSQINRDSEKQKDKIDKVHKKKISVASVPRKIPKTFFIYSTIIALILAFFIIDKIQKDNVKTSKLENAVQISNNAREDDIKKGVPTILEFKKLMITCDERTWISAIIDSMEKKEFILNPQEVLVLNAKERFDLLIGNAGGIKLVLNGKDVDFTGQRGQVKRVTLQ